MMGSWAIQKVHSQTQPSEDIKGGWGGGGGGRRKNKEKDAGRKEKKGATRKWKIWGSNGDKDVQNGQNRPRPIETPNDVRVQKGWQDRGNKKREAKLERKKGWRGLGRKGQKSQRGSKKK